MIMSKISRRAIHAYLVETGDANPEYFRAHDIAEESRGPPTAIARCVNQLQSDSKGITLKQWGQAKSTTQGVEVADA